MGASTANNIPRKECFERILGCQISDTAIIFTFPGIGIGKKHGVLSGCTCESAGYERLARKFMGLGVGVIGVSTGEVPEKTERVRYCRLPESQVPFRSVRIGGEVFLARDTYFVVGDNISVVEVDDVEKHLCVAEKWIGRQLPQLLGLAVEDTRIINFEKNIELSERLESGADSLAILKFETTPKSVLKIGNPKIIDLETEFISDVSGIGKVFPAIYSSGKLSDGNSWYLMEGANPHKCVEYEIFRSLEHGVLIDDWQNRLCDIISPLTTIYRNSIVKHSCRIAQYHYVDRVKSITKRKDFINAYDKLDISHLPCDEFLNQEIVLNGSSLGRFYEVVNHASVIQGKNSPVYSCIIHGDLHLKNILYANESGRYVFIDPRLQWDERPIDKFGYGDPVYDMSTMLHSISSMSFILGCITARKTEEIAGYEVKKGITKITLSDDLLNNLTAADGGIVDVCKNIFPHEVLEGQWESRLYAGASNALFGWLKYINTVRTKEAWIGIYAVSAHYASKSIECVVDG